ncbi:hypothetical protein [Roseisolibacter agri]|uniref:Uncharacterized protein n=1 Tax=Roseisolibacter agri TaxID=2014610 RepID=A0AA37Q941_9BACT|nr:hypothetical protein [Roseisolibacter agri]GLC28554.1 hypothetical protein rosag_50670 [Roseisolibacter agri]
MRAKLTRGHAGDAGGARVVRIGMRRCRPFLRLLAVLLAPLVTGACGWLTGPDAPVDPLAITVAEGELRVANRGARPVHTFAIDRERYALILWAPCVDPVRCPALAPGAVDTTRFDATRNGLARGREALVVWWYARPSPTGPVPDSVHTVVVPL